MADPNIPQWLTADFLRSCLESDEEIPQKIIITHHEVTPAVAPGNNYGSYLFRVNVQYKQTDDLTSAHFINIIVKAPLTDGIMAHFDGEVVDEAYGKEPKFYNEFVKETHSLYKHDIFPKHFNSPNPTCVVMEDLCASGYVMLKRQDLLDFEHSKLYFEAAAKFHALSIAMQKKNPELIQSLSKQTQKYTDMVDQINRSMLYGSMKCMAAFLEDKIDHKDYFDFFTNAIADDTLWEIFYEMEHSDKQLKSLTQGDPWLANMMFKYDDSGKIVGVKLLDFQNVKLKTPLSDFVFFLWVSVKPEVRESKQNEFCHIYCNSFNDTLQQLSCTERLSFEEMQKELSFLSPMALWMISCCVPICTADETADISDYLNGSILSKPIKESAVYRLYNGTTFNKYYPQILGQAAKNGVFKYIEENIQQRKLQKQKP